MIDSFYLFVCFASLAHMDALLDWCLEWTLTEEEITNTFIICGAVLNVYALGCYALVKEQKRLAWMISLLNSGLMCITGLVYFLAKLRKHPEVFLFGKDGPGLFYGNDNLSTLICIWFALANIFDFVYGLLLYPKYLGFLTAYVHHTLFVWIMWFAPTGNGLFMTAPPFAPAFCIMLVEELPTFILALGSVSAAMRTDLGFGVTFFLFRIVFHGYITAYALYAAVTPVVIALYLLTLTLHLNWFYAWVSKYGSKAQRKATKST